MNVRCPLVSVRIDFPKGSCRDGSGPGHKGHILSNRVIAARWRRCAAKSVLTVVGLAIPFALGIEKLALITAIPGAFELVKFALFDAREPPDQVTCEVAAMFLSAKKSLG